MKDLTEILDIRHKNSLRIGIPILSTVIIATASALAYASMFYEKALVVSNTRGVTTPSSSAGSIEISFTPAAIVIWAVAALIVGLSLSVFLRQVSKHISNSPGERGSSPAGQVPVSLEVPGIGSPLSLPSTKGDEWEESPTKKEDKE